MLAINILGYESINIMGLLVSSLQKHISTNNGRVLITPNQFVYGGFFIPFVIFILLLFIETFLGKLNWYVTSCKRRRLRAMDSVDRVRLRGSLDMARTRSKEFDNLQRTIEELPNGWTTRISFADEVMDMMSVMITILIFGSSLLFSNPVYLLLIVVFSIPSIFSEFTIVNRSWDLSQSMIPMHKKRHVLSSGFFGATAFMQTLMFRQGNILLEQILGNHNEVLSQYDRLRLSNLQSQLVTSVISITGLSLVILHAVWSTVSVGGDLGTLTVIIATSRRLQTSLRTIASDIANQWLSARGVVMIEEQYYGLKPKLSYINKHVAFNGIPKISLENVSFRYPDTDRDVLSNVSFAIEPGSFTVILGKNGSGKSTLTSLLLRVYDPTNGSIKLDGIEIKEMSLDSLYELVSALGQNYLIHNRKIVEEVTSSRMGENHSEADIERAIQTSCFDEVLQKKGCNLQTQIGTEHGGTEFSGGEEQRIAAARMFLRRARIMILDEPDSRLDPITASRFMDNLKGIKGNSTIIVITQHTALAEGADKIIVMDSGSVAQSGTHAELIQSDGLYLKMIREDKKR